jgi:hypothetical protein
MSNLLKFSTGRLGEQIPSVCEGTSYQSAEDQNVYDRVDSEVVGEVQMIEKDESCL